MSAPVRGGRAVPPGLRLLLAATAACTIGLAGGATGARAGDSWPVGSIVPKAEMVPWGGGGFSERPPEPARPRGPAPVSPFAMDDGYVPPAPPGGVAAPMYGALYGEDFVVPAVPLGAVDPAFLRTTVPDPTGEPPGTIVVDPAARYLYLVEEGGQAIRYGVGVGREGFGWSGTAVVKVKRTWPDWHPPRAMIERQPALEGLLTSLPSGVGMAGGPDNPLGARALYLYQGGRDTLYRIHGTTEPDSIGKSVSSGCIRMLNQDVIDLYERVPAGTRVVVLGSG